MSDAFLVRRGGSGGLSPNSAVIHVTALAGSTISFAKGGVVAKVLGPDKSHVKASDSSFAEWYYAISPSNYGEWTVTAIRSSDQATESKNVTVSENKQYDLEIIFRFYVFREGYGLPSGYTYKSTTTDTGGGIAVNLNYIYLSNYSICILPAVDITNYDVLNCTVTEAASGGYGAIAIGNPDNIWNANLGNYTAIREITTPGTYTLDISGYTGTFFIKARSTNGRTITNIWLSR